MWCLQRTSLVHYCVLITITLLPNNEALVSLPPAGKCELWLYNSTVPIATIEEPQVTSNGFENVLYNSNPMFGFPTVPFFNRKVAICNQVTNKIESILFDQTAPSTMSSYSIYPGGSPLEVMLTCQNCSIVKFTLQDIKLSSTPDSSPLARRIFPKEFLVYVDLSNARIYELDVDAFKDFTKVTQIVLDNNMIDIIPENTFRKLGAGIQITLKYNQMRTISKAFCYNEFNLIYLQFNQIINMDVDCTIDVSNLNISHNNLEGVSWEKLKNTKILDLSFNKIKSINAEDASNLEELTYLSLSNNELTKLNRRSFRRFTKLTTLKVSHNKITSIDSEAFKDLRQLTLLDLSSNQITEIPFGIFRDCETLSTLNVASNRIRTLSMQTFSGLTGLLNLNMSENYLNGILNTDLLQIRRLQSLDLSHNRLQKIDIKSILVDHSLTWISLNQNYWNCRQLLQIMRHTKEKYCTVQRGSYFGVPNIHGIACSTIDVNLSLVKNFESFLDNLSDEKEMEIALAQIDSTPPDEESDLEDLIFKIKSLVLLIAVVSVVDFIFTWLFRLYKARYTVNIPITQLR